MLVYRIVQSLMRANDLSGTGAFRVGGRWNSKGTYMLYTSENSSLAYLEILVHFDESELPPNLFILTIDIADTAPVFILPDKLYPANWQQLELLTTKATGDRLMADGKYLAIKVKSAINVVEYNYLLNPLFPGYNKLVKVIDVREIQTDRRLARV